MSQDWVTYIKERVRLQDVLHFYNVSMTNPRGDESQYRCPLHGSGRDAKPSARVYSNGTGYCWGCGESFDSISFVQRYEGKSFQETLRFMERSFGLTPWRVLEEKAPRRAAFSLDTIFEAEKPVDVESRWESVNSLLIRNKSCFDLTSYVSFCDVLDHLWSDTLTQRIDTTEIVKILDAVKDKILLKI
jgi:hypothetical protein